MANTPVTVTQLGMRPPPMSRNEAHRHVRARFCAVPEALSPVSWRDAVRYCTAALAGLNLTPGRPEEPLSSADRNGYRLPPKRNGICPRSGDRLPIQMRTTKVPLNWPIVYPAPPIRGPTPSGQGVSAFSRRIYDFGNVWSGARTFTDPTPMFALPRKACRQSQCSI